MGGDGGRTPRTKRLGEGEGNHFVLAQMVQQRPRALQTSCVSLAPGLAWWAGDKSQLSRPWFLLLEIRLCPHSQLSVSPTAGSLERKPVVMLPWPKETPTPMIRPFYTELGEEKERVNTSSLQRGEPF